MEEAIGWNMADFTDNRPCLDLLEGSPGIFALLNEVQCHETVTWHSCSLLYSDMSHTCHTRNVPSIERPMTKCWPIASQQHLSAVSHLW